MGLTTCNSSSNSLFFGGHLVYYFISIWNCQARVYIISWWTTLISPHVWTQYHSLVSRRKLEEMEGWGPKEVHRWGGMVISVTFESSSTLMKVHIPVILFLLIQDLEYNSIDHTQHQVTHTNRIQNEKWEGPHMMTTPQLWKETKASNLLASKSF